MKKSKALYLGLDPARFSTEREVVHFPIIEIHSFEEKIENLLMKWEKFTHLIITSRTAALLFAGHFEGKEIFAVGAATAQLLPLCHVAPHACGEGVIELLEGFDLSEAHVLYPHSALSRPLIENYLEERGIIHTCEEVYTTRTRLCDPLPNLAEFEEIVFTSPSTVEAFLEIFGPLPFDKQLTPIGPVTKKAMEDILAMSYSQCKNKERTHGTKIHPS